MQEEEAKRLVAEETSEFKKPKDKEEKRFLRVVAHFDSLLFRESLIGKPIPEGEKSATLPMKFKLQGEGIFTAFFFHIVSIATYVLALLLAFWVKYNPDSIQFNKACFSSPVYSAIVSVAAGLILASVPLFFIKRYIVYPEGYLFVRVYNFLVGYWLAVIILIALEIVKLVVTHLSGESLVTKLLPVVYRLIGEHPTAVPIVVAFSAVVLILVGIMLLLITRKDYANAIGLILLMAGVIFGILGLLLHKYGYTPRNAEWLVYYLSQFLLSAFSDKAELAAVVLPLTTYFYFRKRVNGLKRKMYGMPYS